MKRDGTELDPELAALLEFRKAERRLRPEVRARVLARSRAIVSSRAWLTRAPAPPTPTPTEPRSSSAPAWRGPGLARLALAASIAMIAGAVGAMAALRARATADPRAAVAVADTPPPPPPRAYDEAASNRSPDPPPVAVQHAATIKPARAARAADPFNGEVKLFRRAHVAYAHRNFSAALALVQEHARRFPKGPLAEEREALRIESLAGLGLTEEARRRAAAFAARFPRSVLLSRVEEAAEETVP